MLQPDGLTERILGIYHDARATSYDTGIITCLAYNIAIFNFILMVELYTNNCVR